MKKELPLIALGIIAAAPAFASQQSTSQGFIEDSHLDLFLRNAYIKRDYRDGLPDKAEWGQGIIATFESGFTQGPVGFGVDGIAQYAVEAHGVLRNAVNAKFGATAKMRFSNTVLSYGSQRPMLPIVYADDSRLLYESYTGTMLTSREIDGLEINAGYLTDQQRKSDDSHNSGLKSLTFGGASYQFNDQLSGALYASHVEDVLNKQYLGLNYKQPFATDQQLIVDFNGYNSRLNQEYADANGTGRSNSIWSLAASYIWDIHTFKVAYQQSSGSTGYHYGGYQNQGGVGDGGNTIWLANSYWSDFNGEDERSWQASYGLDFAGLGVPGLSWTTAYVRGDNIKTAETSNGKEHEWFNQVQYQVQNGMAKDLKLRLRYSVLRVSSNASDYNVSGNEVRFYVEYPFDVF
ncbi:outer membrane porin, OprD family [Klebsiella pneumoniae]|nr:outer membrane porin, OprD family [Klebsiella pneumoniae]